MTGHVCHALRCAEEVPPRLLMCRRHWRKVPRRLQRALQAAYVPGQEARKDPSDEYLRIAGECVRVVADREAAMAAAGTA